MRPITLQSFKSRLPRTRTIRSVIHIYEAMRASANEYWDASDAAFEKAGDWNERGDQLQLVMMIMALGLAFAAWASLLKEESKMRLLFAVLAVATLIVGVITYLGVPTVTG